MVKMVPKPKCTKHHQYGNTILYTDIKGCQYCRYCVDELVEKYGMLIKVNRIYNNKLSEIEIGRAIKYKNEIKQLFFEDKLTEEEICDAFGCITFMFYDTLRRELGLKSISRTQLRAKFGFTKALKEKVKERDNFKCQSCGKKVKSLEIHHKDGRFQNNNLDNLITLCRSCHNRAHLTDNVCVGTAWRHLHNLESHAIW